MSAMDDFRAWYDKMLSSGEDEQMAEAIENNLRNINDAGNILSDLRHDRISEDEAREQARALFERTYKEKAQ